MRGRECFDPGSPFLTRTTARASNCASACVVACFAVLLTLPRAEETRRRREIANIEAIERTFSEFEQFLLAGRKR